MDYLMEKDAEEGLFWLLEQSNLMESEPSIYQLYPELA